jgi:Ca2+-binding RTX toxin-like protein
VRVDPAGGAVNLVGTGAITQVEVFNGMGQAVRGTSGSNVLDFSGFTSVVGVASISGLGGNDTMTGSGSGDLLDGAGGTDLVDGGGGDDTILIRGSEAQSDTLTGGAGTDTLKVDPAGGVVTLAGTGNIGSIENFDGSGQAVRGTGSANVFDFSIFNSVVGVASISGLGGADTLTGTGGADVLIGGSGADRLTGGGGDDVFAYGNLSESTSSSRDVIVDFTGAGVAGGDVIDVSAVIAGQFAFNGTGAFSGGGIPSIRYVVSGGVTDVLFDNGTGGAAEMIVRINSVVTLSGGDFIL